MQTLLDARPDADVAVFAVWLPALAADTRSFWDPELLHDRRVAHLWDGKRATGNWFGARDGTGFTWDVFYLFAPNTHLKTSTPVATGRPVVAQLDRLARELDALT